MSAPDPPEDWPLILWRNCICLTENSTVTAAPFVPPATYAGTQFRGQSLYAYQDVMYVAAKEALRTQA